MDDALQRRGDGAVRGDEIRRILLEDRGHRVGGRVAFERSLPREHLVEHGAEREDVGALVRGLAAHLLGRHVGERAEDRARLRVAAHRRDVGRTGYVLLLLRQLRQAEVEDLDAAVGRDEEVVGLQVAVDDALFVRGRERLDDLDGVVERLAQREPAGAEEVAQRVALEKLLDQEMPLVDLLERMDRRDAGMAESGQRLRFALEAGDVLRVAEELIGEHLDRDVAIEPQVPGAIHLSHAAGAEGREDLVGAESVARREQEWSLAGIITSSVDAPTLRCFGQNESSTAHRHGHEGARPLVRTPYGRHDSWDVQHQHEVDRTSFPTRVPQAMPPGWSRWPRRPRGKPRRRRIPRTEGRESTRGVASVARKPE